MTNKYTHVMEMKLIRTSDKSSNTYGFEPTFSLKIQKNTNLMEALSQV